MPRLHLAVPVLVVWLAGCGGGSPSSPTPPPAAATVTSVTLSPLEFVRLNSPQRLTMTATMSDGSSRVVQATWQSSDLAVATIDGEGLVTPVTSGEMTITAQYQAHRVERRMRVVPNYDGNWVGGYRITTCTDTGDWEGVCEGEDPDTEWAMEAAFTQSGGQVSGEVAPFEDVAIPVVGVIATNGRLAVAGEIDLDTEVGPFVVQVVEWDTVAFESNRQMNGRYQVVGSAPDLAGEFRYFCEITVMDKLLATTSRLSPRGLLVKPRPRPRLRSVIP